MPNRLAAESSPYLRQHADNPVDWQPWGPDALERARTEDRPILLSIGYAACHWCHVMAHESFEDDETAALMNQLYVNVKVDREERPDVDNLYQTAVQLLHRSGGWPLTAFLLPDGRPFFAGTYFPDTPRHGMPAFRDVLRGVHRAWIERREEILASAGGIAEAVVRVQSPEDGGAVPPAGLVGRAAAALTEQTDWTWGGMRGAPKFPSPPNLWTQLRAGIAGDRRSLDALLLTLRKMAEGGIHDQLGGGFHRYSTDEQWLVPHFEKMLYDNAQLVPLYLHAWRLTGDAELGNVARSTLDYVLREMTAPDGCFYASTDADSEGEEGRFFVWTPEALHAVLADAELERCFARAYDVTAAGNWEGRSILRRRQPWAAVAAELGLAEATLRERVEQARPKLYAARAARVPPLRDEKIIVAWNALMISALVEGARATGEARYLDAARRAADALLRTLVRDGALAHSRCDGDVKGPGLLDDHAALGEAMLDLYEADGDPRRLDAALALAGELGRFRDGAGWFQTPHDGEALFARPRETHDGALPSGSALAASFLHRLWAHTGEARWRDAVEETLSLHGGQMARNPYGSGTLLGVLDRWHRGFVEVVIGGAGEERRAMERVAFEVPGLDRMVLDLGALRPGHPAGQGRAATEPTAWVCRAGTCSLPVRGAVALRAELSAGRG